jgi:hypothetical protein
MGFACRIEFADKFDFETADFVVSSVIDTAHTAHQRSAVSLTPLTTK